MPTPLLTRRTLLLAKIETTYNVDSVPTASADALLAEDADYSVDVNVSERNFYSDTLSPLASKVGRKLAKVSFGMELRSNGATNSGNLANAPRLGRLLRACGFSETAVPTGTGTIGAVVAAATNTGVAPTWSATGSNASGNRADYTITVVTAGASATAKARVSGGRGNNDTTYLRSETFAFKNISSAAGTCAVNTTNPLGVTYTFAGTWVTGEKFTITCGGYDVDFVVGATATPTGVGAQVATALTASVGPFTAANSTGTVTITFTGTAAGTILTTAVTTLTLGTTGASVTPTWTGNLALGDKFTVTAQPIGIKYAPVSTNVESVTIYFYRDGILHKMTGAIGTFTIEAEAGAYAKIQFEFTGQYVAPITAPIPSATHESTLPAVVELARIAYDDYPVVVQRFNYDQNNTISPRPDMNYSGGYNGVRLVSRAPNGGIDPEATLSNDYDFWTKMANSTGGSLQLRVGYTAGNTVWLAAPNVQITGLTYQDRDGLVTYDSGLQFNRVNADDEFVIHFA